MTDYGYDNGTTMGHSGVDTSQERAESMAKSGKASMLQRTALMLLDFSEAEGMTWVDLSEGLEVHHGTASSLLTNLHKAGRIVRLKEKREKSRVYVLPKYINGREYDDYKQRTKTVECPNCAHNFTA